MVGDVDPGPGLLADLDGLLNVFDDAGGFTSHVDGKDAVFLSHGLAEGNKLPAVAKGRRGVDEPVERPMAPSSIPCLMREAMADRSSSAAPLAPGAP